MLLVLVMSRDSHQKKGQPAGRLMEDGAGLIQINQSRASPSSTPNLAEVFLPADP